MLSHTFSNVLCEFVMTTIGELMITDGEVMITCTVLMITVPNKHCNGFQSVILIYCMYIILELIEKKKN